MKKLLILSIAIFSMGLTAQVGINNPTPDASAALDITSTEGGILIPRMTETERDAITAAARWFIDLPNRCDCWFLLL